MAEAFRCDRCKTLFDCKPSLIDYAELADWPEFRFCIECTTWLKKATKNIRLS
jgi:hypothetical protein